MCKADNCMTDNCRLETCTQLTLFILVHILSIHLVVLPAQDKQQDRRQPDSAAKRSTPAKYFAAPDADISSDETHPQPPLKADLSDGPAFEAPAKSGGSELFDALLMAATGKRIISVNASLEASHRLSACNQLSFAVHFSVRIHMKDGEA